MDVTPVKPEPVLSPLGRVSYRDAGTLESVCALGTMGDKKSFSLWAFNLNYGPKISYEASL